MLIKADMYAAAGVTPHAEWFITGSSNLYKPNVNRGSTDGNYELATYGASSVTILKKCSCVQSNNNFGGNRSITVKNVGDVINQTNDNVLWVLINDQD